MYGFLPLLRYRLHVEQFWHTKVLEDLEDEVGREAPNDVESRLCVLLQKQYLQTDVARHAGVQDGADPRNRCMINLIMRFCNAEGRTVAYDRLG